jgi:hypothetical protein
MKLLRAVVIVLLLGSSSATAQSFYFGVRFDAPVFLGEAVQTASISVLPMFGLQIGVDFPLNDIGLRASVSSQFNSDFRIGFDAYKRFTLQPELHSYFGGAGSFFSTPQLFAVTLRFLLGFEYRLSPMVGLFAEFSPGAAFGFICVNGKSSGCGLLTPVVLESAIGLNFRF